MFFFFKQKTAYEMRISDWSSDVCSSDLLVAETGPDFLIFFYGCQYVGLIPVPLPLTIHLGGHDAYVDRLRTMIAKAGAEIAVGPADMLHYLKEAAADGRMVGTPGDFYSLPAEGGDLRPFGKDESGRAHV